MRNALMIVFATVAFAAAACGDDPDPTDIATTPGDVGAPVSETASASETGPGETGTPADVAGADAAVHVVTTELGDILADAEGRTLYVFMPDGQGEPTCYDECEQTWPPFVGPADAGAGVEAALIATVGRDDGSQQVTYNGWPLHYFADDAAPGDINGQGMGDAWFVVGVDGEPVEDAAATDGADDY